MTDLEASLTAGADRPVPRRKGAWRLWVRRLHMLLGLSSGLIVLLLGLTGSIYAFESELQDLVYPFRKVPIQSVPYQPPSVLRARAQAALGDLRFDLMEYKGPGRAVEVIAEGEEPHYHWRLYLDPYSGEVLAKQNLDTEFFETNLRLHMYLLLPEELGATVVGSAVLVFVVMLGTGIALWWPRSRKRQGEAFRIKWRAAPARRFYDLHSVFGFYAAWVLLVIALAGLGMAFSWVDDGYQLLANGGQQPAGFKAPKSRPGSASQTDRGLDRAVADIMARYPDYGKLGVGFPKKETGALVLYVYPARHQLYNQHRWFYDQYTGEVLGDRGARSAGEQLNWMYHDIHIGKIVGLPGQILAFGASLTAASLPVTGFLMWWSRRRRSSRRGQKPA